MRHGLRVHGRFDGGRGRGKVTRAAEHALAARIPLVVVSSSGGARMQEGTTPAHAAAKTLLRSPGCAPRACRSSAC